MDVDGVGVAARDLDLPARVIAGTSFASIEAAGADISRALCDREHLDRRAETTDAPDPIHLFPMLVDERRYRVRRPHVFPDPEKLVEASLQVPSGRT